MRRNIRIECEAAEQAREEKKQGKRSHGTNGEGSRDEAREWSHGVERMRTAPASSPASLLKGIPTALRPGIALSENPN